VVAGTTDFVGAIICESLNAGIGAIESGSLDTDALVVNSTIAGGTTSIILTSATKSNSLTAVNNTITSTAVSSLKGATVTLGSVSGGGIINIGGLSDAVFVSGIPFEFYFQQYVP
jgi:hypothetical protein